MGFNATTHCGTQPFDLHGDGGSTNGDLAALLTTGSPGGKSGERPVHTGGRGGRGCGAIEIGALGSITMKRYY
jgi:hypothetical protein